MIAISSTSGISVGQLAASCFLQIGQLLRREAAQAGALRLEMHLHEHAVEVHERGHDRRDDDRLVRQVQELDHQERRRAHDRRRDLPAGRRRGFDGAGEVARIAEANHRGDRQRADRHGVRDRRARQHAEERRREHAHLRRTAGIAPGDRRRDVDEELAQADARREHAEQHEVEHERRDHADRDAVDALARHVQVIDEARPRRAGMLEQAREHRAGERVEHEHDRDDRQRPSHRAPGRLEQQHDEDRSHHHVDRQRIADAKREILEDPRDVEHGRGDRESQHPVDERNAAGRQPRVLARALPASTCAPERRGRRGRARTRDGCRDASSRAAGRSRRCSSGSTTARSSSVPTTRVAGGTSGRNRISGSYFSSSSVAFVASISCTRVSSQGLRRRPTPATAQSKRGRLAGPARSRSSRASLRPSYFSMPFSL